MTLQNIVPVIGLNEVSGGGLLIANSLIRTAKNVKIYRSRCEHLSRQCLDLISALRDHSSGHGSSGAQQAVDEVERVLTRILNRVRKWEEMGKVRSFAKQTEIKLGLDESYQELRACSMRFNIALHLDANNRSRELEETRKHDHDELIEMIARALHDNARGTEKEKETLVFPKGRPSNVEPAPERPKVSADAKENAKPPPKKASSAKKSTETTKAAPTKKATTTKTKKPADKSATAKKPAAPKKASTTKKAATAKEPSTEKTTSAKSDAKETAAKAAASAKAKAAPKGAAAKPSSKKSPTA